jgi:cytochrome c553
MTKFLPLLAASAALFTIPVTCWGQGGLATEPINELERQALNPSRAMIEQGKSVAQSACASCHGLDGISTGEGTPHLAGQRTVYLYRVLQAYKDRDRKNDAMVQAKGFLNKQALLDVSAYYANQPPAQPQQASTESSTAGSGDPFAGIRDDMKKCVKCHGEDGNASASGMPNLSAQHPDYFVESMKAYVEGSRNHGLMKKLAANLDDTTLTSMGVFYAVQVPARTETTGDGDTDLGKILSEPCAACHGADGNADGANMPTLAGQDARYFVKAMQAYKDGKRKHEQMFDAVDELSDADINNLAAFYAGQEPVRRNVRTPLTTAEWVDRCERCHGIDGNSTDPRFPMLAGQERTYLANAFQAYISNTRGNSIMHAMSDPLSQADLERIVEHYATRSPKSVIYMQIPCEQTTDD